ncbi:MAG: hypothetical protein Fur0020_02710 [Thermodesulfovibrionia bacterium]
MGTDHRSHIFSLHCPIKLGNDEFYKLFVIPDSLIKSGDKFNRAIYAKFITHHSINIASP